jgi:CheY-like chemotaxis protein
LAAQHGFVLDENRERMNQLRGGHILLVEDNQINQIVAVDVLQNMGLHVTVAWNGEQAVELVNKEHFDALLMDIQMPGMDGYQTTAQIRKDLRFDKIRLPIIAMTAAAMEGDRQKALDADLNDYIPKPVNVTQLANVLLRWVHPQQAQSALVPAAITQGSDELPAFLDLIDMSAALQRLDNNRQLYRRLLLIFHADHKQDVQRIRVALQENDLELARRLAHTLKGSAGTVGSDELRSAAKDLEMVIAEGRSPEYAASLERVEQKLALVMASIASFAAAGRA